MKVQSRHSNQAKNGITSAINQVVEIYGLHSSCRLALSQIVLTRSEIIVQITDVNYDKVGVLNRAEGA